MRANWAGMIPLGRATDGRLYYGWFVLAVVAGMHFANGATAIAVLTVGVVPLSTEFGWTRTQISAVTSVSASLGHSSQAISSIDMARVSPLPWVAGALSWACRAWQ